MQAIGTLKLFNMLQVRMAREPLNDRCVIENYTALQNYLITKYRYRLSEEISVLYLSCGNSIIRDEVHSNGTVDQATIYPREIVRRAILLGATSIILVHNHPSRIPTPSLKDIAATKSVIQSCQALGITFRDHVIIAGDQYVSLRTLGHLT